MHTGCIWRLQSGLLQNNAAFLQTGTELCMMLQKDKDGDIEVPAEGAMEAPKEAPDAASAQAQAAAAAAAARRLNVSAAAAENVSIAAMKRAAEFVKVRRVSIAYRMCQALQMFDICKP